MLTEQEIRELLNDLIQIFLIPKFMSLGMNASGNWLQSLSVETAPNQGYILGADYTEYLTLGRTPNLDQSPEAINGFARWAGSTFLKKWVADKGLNLNPYAVAYKIAREGTEYYPDGTDLLEVMESEEVANFIRERIGRTVAVSIQMELERLAKSMVA